MTMPVVDGCRSGDDASNDNDSTDGDGSGNYSRVRVPKVFVCVILFVLEFLF